MSTDPLQLIPQRPFGALAASHRRRFGSGRAAALLLLGLCLLPVRTSQAISTVMLEAPQVLEAIGATTFDEHGIAVGESSFDIETEPDGVRLMRVTMAIKGGGSNVSQATLAPFNLNTSDSSDSINLQPNDGLAVPAENSGVTLRIIEERSQATRADGVSLPLLVIDHQRGRVSCYPADQDPSAGQHVDIPGEDRVVNVPMQLLFMPLVRGEVDDIHFQIATCVPDPKLNQMIAVRGPTIVRDGRKIVEIKYGPDFGKTVAWFASRLLPSFSFWFDTESGNYLGHRMPIHREGPEVVLVRSGLTPPDIGLD
jgi:hypothetical protein